MKKKFLVTFLVIIAVLSAMILTPPLKAKAEIPFVGIVLVYDCIIQGEPQTRIVSYLKIEPEGSERAGLMVFADGASV